MKDVWDNSENVVTLEVFASICQYWDERVDRWSTDGCRVLPTSTSQHTHCGCSHLTWFGSGFLVPPNQLDISKAVREFKNISDHPALLATICIISGVYLLAIK